MFLESVFEKFPVIKNERSQLSHILIAWINDKGVYFTPYFKSGILLGNYYIDTEEKFITNQIIAL